MTDNKPERQLTDLMPSWSPTMIDRMFWLLAAVSAVAAWIIRFVQDDAFITFRYARNFARGNGLVLNPGERVEGYTNFLWTVMMAIPEKLGWSAPDFSVYVGIVVMVLTMWVVYRWSQRILGSQRLGLLAVAVLVANMSFLAYGTGGLETMMQTLLVSSVGLLTMKATSETSRVPPAVRRVAAGVVAGIACLTRLDSAVLVGTWFVLVVVGEMFEEPAVDRPWRVITTALQLGVPVVAILTPWIIWKLDYYGELLPNTQAAKSAGFVIPFLFGIFYLLCFFGSYLAFLMIGRYRRSKDEWWGNPLAKRASIAVGVWFLYICVVGADFMEFRFIVPVLPILAMLMAVLINQFRSVRGQVVLVAVLLIVSGLHRITPGIAYPVLTLKDLSHWPTESKTAWKGMGEYLGSTFPGGPDAANQPVVALAPLGLISYYSDLPVVDMLGLADREIAQHGDVISPYYPGHVHIGTVDQLVKKRVTLIVGEPLLAKPGEYEEFRYSQLTKLYPSVDLRRLDEEVSVVMAPLTDGVVWPMIYLQPNPKVDELIGSGEWQQVPINRRCDAADLNVLTKLLAKKTCPELSN